jgi:hypothetical protein
MREQGSCPMCGLAEEQVVRPPAVSVRRITPPGLWSRWRSFP